MRKYYNKYNFVHGCLRNVGNVLRFGLSAPKVAERIWVNTKQCEKILDGEVIREIFRVSNMRYVSGLVVNSEWPIEKSCNVSEVSIIKDCIMHWVDGVSWENTGAYERMMKRIDQKGKADGCKNLIDVRNRYRNLDVIYSQIKKEGLNSTSANPKAPLKLLCIRVSSKFNFHPLGERKKLENKLNYQLLLPNIW